MERHKRNNGLLIQWVAVGRLVLLSVCLTAFAIAQSGAEEEANKLLQDSKWKQAEQSYGALVSKEPKNGAAWTGLGEAQLQQKEFAAAERSFNNALQLEFRIVSSRMNLARVAAAQGDRSRLLTLLHALVQEGQGGKARAFLAYPEFDGFRSNPEFSRIVEEDMLPCKAEHYRDFDFWIGEWEVYDPQENQLLGHNSVTREQEGCLLVEHWKAARGLESGMSFNYLDIHDSTWRQMYIDNSGDSRAYPLLIGRLLDGKMTLLSEAKDGVQTRWIWSLLAPGKVRQRAEQTADSGKTWNTVWDSLYLKQ